MNASVALRKHTLLPIVSYAGLAMLVMGPALLPGYILLLDMIFTPKLQFSTQVDNLWLIHVGLNTLNLLIPAWILQKLLLLAIFALAGVGVHRLVGVILAGEVVPVEKAGPHVKEHPATSAAGTPAPPQLALYAAGIFYVVNPFTYGRLMAGQYLVLAGYALLPWLTAALLRWVRRPGLRTALIVAAWLIAISLVSLHTLGFGLLLTAAAGALALWRYRRRRAELLWVLGSGALMLGALVLASSYWLVPLLTHHSDQAGLIAGFDVRHFLSFRTEPDPLLGVAGNVLGLYGSWFEREVFYILPKTVNPLWPVTGLGPLALVLAGAVWGLRHRRLAAALLLAALVCGWVLAQGINGTPVAQLNYWLLQALPLYAGYREPGKFIALIALAEAALLGLGAAWLLSRTAAWRTGFARAVARLLPAVIIALPFAYVPTMLWGAGGQLRATDYPADWYALNQKLGPTGGKVLFLPWHQYMYFDFAGRVIANPAPRFFDRPTLAGDNAEIGLIERQTTNPTSTAIEQDILAPDADQSRIGERLTQLGIEYIVVYKDALAPDDNYSWLAINPDIQVEQDTATLSLFRNTKWKAQP